MRNRTWGLRIFSLSYVRDKTKNIFLYFFTELKTYHLSYSSIDIIKRNLSWSLIEIFHSDGFTN